MATLPGSVELLHNQSPIPGLPPADLHGKVGLIDFWATRCAPCKREILGYQVVMDRYAGRGSALVGLQIRHLNNTEDPVQF
jgi:thiol-disulfide isomerase/thioredoxin